MKIIVVPTGEIAFTTMIIATATLAIVVAIMIIAFATESIVTDENAINH